MTGKTSTNRMGWVYLLAIPMVLAIFLLQGGMLFRTLSFEAGLSQAASVLDRCDAIFSSLQQAAQAAGGRGHAALSSSASNLYDAAALRLSGALQQLQELTKSDPATQLEYKRLEAMVKSQTDSWKQSVNSKMTGWPGVSTGGNPADQKWMPEIDKTISNIKNRQETRMQEEADGAMYSLRVTVNLFKFGGFFILWIVVAVTFLLFYGQRNRVSADVGNRTIPRKELSGRPFSN